MLCSLAFSLATASVASAALTASHDQPLPLLIWHGLGDTYDADGIASVGDLARQVNPETFVYNIRVSNDSSSDQRATFFGNTTEQIQSVCEDLATHPVLSKANAVNALGFSQGGQFLRAYVERCNLPPIRNLVTFGSQHNGIDRFQGCGPNDWLCKGAQGLLKANTWSSFAQSSLVPAQYFRDPSDLDPYLENSNLLADINNERKVKEEQYKKGISGLEKFVMYVFEDDVTVHPKESGWFAEKNRTSGVVTELRDRDIYKQDWIGLKSLDKKGGLVFRTAPGAHMKLTDKVLKESFGDYFGSSKAASDETLPKFADGTEEAVWNGMTDL